MALRIQRRRTKGWRAPAGSVYVGRPTKWGNPHRVSATQRVDVAVARYRADLLAPVTEPLPHHRYRHRADPGHLAALTGLRVTPHDSGELSDRS